MHDHPNALPAGYRLGEYEIQTVLGSGGFGVTYKAHDHDLDKTVAIKEYLPPDFAVRVGRTTVGPKSEASKDDYDWGLARVLDEARTLARFDHPHINKVHRFIKANGTAYLVLEYIEGDMLSDLLRDKGRFSEAAIRRMLDELLDGLAAVHKAGYVHRDIKPANIIFRRDGSAVLLDFGAARQARGKTVTKVLTANYAPVEQHLNNPVGARSDIYSLGICAYRCLTGGGESKLVDALARALLIEKGQAKKDMPSATVVGKGKYSDGLLKAIDWAIKVEASERPQSVAAWRAALAGEDKPAATSPSPKPKPKPKPKSKPKPQPKPAATPTWPKSLSELISQLVRAWKAVTAPQHKRRNIIVSIIVVGVLLLNGCPAYEEWRIETERVKALELKARARQQADFRRLVGRDASWRKVYPSGTTDLHIAAANGWAELAKWLIDDGANVHAQIKSDGNKMSATLKKRLNISGVWRRAGQRPLYFAATRGRVSTAKVLLTNGAKVNARNGYGHTPLHNAAWNNQTKMIRFLISNGAEVNAKSNGGATPLDNALENNRREAEIILRTAGGRCSTKCN